MIRLIMSILLGVIPDVLYYFLYIKFIKQNKKYNVLFFTLLFVIYMILNIVVKHNFYLYLLYDLFIFITIKLLYKSKITDVFLIVVLELYLMFSSSLCFIFIKNYCLSYIINRLIIFLPLLLKNKLINIYNLYNSLWNRHNNSKLIKSITLRNISLILFNFLIVFIYILLIYIITIKS